jgi:hypothetical protein
LLKARGDDVIANEKIQELLARCAFAVLALDCALALGLIGFLVHVLLLRTKPSVFWVLLGAIAILAIICLLLLALSCCKHRPGCNKGYQRAGNSPQGIGRSLEGRLVEMGIVNQRLQRPADTD